MAEGRTKNKPADFSISVFGRFSYRLSALVGRTFFRLLIGVAYC